MSDDRDSGGMPPPPPPPGGGGASPPGGPGWDEPTRDTGDTGHRPAGQGSWSQPPSQEHAPQHGGGWGAEPAYGPQPGGLGLRIGAYLIDTILLGIVIAIVTVVLGVLLFTGEAVSGGVMGFGGGGGVVVRFIAGLLSAAITLGYFGVLEGRNGQTVGKMLLNLRAVKADGSALSTEDAVKRRIPFIIGSLVPFGILGSLVSLGIAIAILVTAAQDRPYNRGLHDQWADTMVIKS